jgi:uncharacterized protein YqfA (UPF0365 family)
MPAAQASPETLMAAILVLVVLLVNVVLLVLFAKLFSRWLRAYLSGVPVPVLDMIGMRLRKTDVTAVVEATIAAKQAGVFVPWREMERAWALGIDLEKVTLAAVQAEKQNREFTFQELVDAELAGRLSEKLGLGSPAEVEEEVAV